MSMRMIWNCCLIKYFFKFDIFKVIFETFLLHKKIWNDIGRIVALNGHWRKLPKSFNLIINRVEMTSKCWIKKIPSSHAKTFKGWFIIDRNLSRRSIQFVLWVLFGFQSLSINFSFCSVLIYHQTFLLQSQTRNYLASTICEVIKVQTKQSLLIIFNTVKLAHGFTIQKKELQRIFWSFLLSFYKTEFWGLLFLSLLYLFQKWKDFIFLKIKSF